MYGKSGTCVISRASLSCWRRKLLSSASIEQGSHVCWLFAVEHNNTTSVVQYMGVKDFPEEMNGCQSAELCGMEEWPCRISKDDQQVISLRWKYPFQQVIYCSIGVVSTIIFGTIAGWRFYRGHGNDSDTQDNDVSESTGDAIPFMISRRIPTWMENKPMPGQVSAPPPVDNI